MMLDFLGAGDARYEAAHSGISGSHRAGDCQRAENAGYAGHGLNSAGQRGDLSGHSALRGSLLSNGQRPIVRATAIKGNPGQAEGEVRLLAQLGRYMHLIFILGAGNSIVQPCSAACSAILASALSRVESVALIVWAKESEETNARR
nr:Uncharacterised protein [Raoultella sp. NCTC 9187]